MTANDAAKLLGLSEGEVYRLCRAKRITHLRLGCGRGRIQIEPEAVEAYKDSCRVGPAVKRARKYTPIHLGQS